MSDGIKMTQCEHCGAWGGEHAANCPTLPKPVEVQHGICESCLTMTPKKDLARFGRQGNSPLVCRRCAEYMIEILKKKVIDPFHRTKDGKTEIIN